MSWWMRPPSDLLAKLKGRRVGLTEPRDFSASTARSYITQSYVELFFAWKRQTSKPSPRDDLPGNPPAQQHEVVPLINSSIDFVIFPNAFRELGGLRSDSAYETE